MEARKKRERVREPSEPELKRDFKREKTEYGNGVSGAWNATTTPFDLHQFPTVQYLPLNNGSPLPCWVGGEKIVGAGVDGVNGGRGGNIKAQSNGSSRCSSSVVSDYQSSSGEDGGSTDSHSHSVHSLAEPTQLNTSKETISIGTQPEESVVSASSHPIMRPKQGNNTITTIQEMKHIAKEKTQEPIILPIIDLKPLSNENITKVEIMGKTPKPLSQTSSSLPQMPYVFTKGDNGRTVNGFLYRYTKSEVSIVCVCHGSTFSPAEFVQHAGGTDTTHPLRHITVIPSAFG
ncbi:Ninja-family protein AFP3 [Glycine soja]|uniref:Ninja-family protein n=1 Tax=Glycine soja TaxID=3848 RepID=A0A0B2R069_GLYSO|nr:Ninja-family protein AFP3 [Glycine soja]